MNIIGICIFCVIAGILSVFLKSYRPEYSTLITVSSSCAVILIICVQIGKITDFINASYNDDVIKGEYIEVIIKAAGVCFVSHLGSSICKDCGQTTLAQQIELASKVSISILALPIFTELLKTASALSFV